MLSHSHLHVLEMVLQLSYLVILMTVGDCFIIMTVCNAVGRLGQEDKRQESAMDDKPAEQCQEENADKGYQQDISQQPVIVTKDIFFRIDDTHTPAHIGQISVCVHVTYKRLVEDITVLAVHPDALIALLT